MRRLPSPSPARVSRGFEFMAGKSVVICGLARDCAQRLPGVIQQVERLGDLFRSYDVIVVENDSKDGTGTILDDWAQRNPTVNTIRFSCVPSWEATTTSQESQGAAWFRASRIKRICFARNIYLRELESRQADFVIVLDLDLLKLSIEGIASSFAAAEQWKAVAANGVRYTLRAPTSPWVYWDTYAYEPESGFENSAQTLAGIRRKQRMLAQRLRTGEWLTARSAFGGLCIYQADLLAGIEYSVLPNDDPDVPWLCEHIGLHRAIRKRDPGFKVHINPAQTVTYESLPRTITRSLAGAFTRR